MFFVRFCFSKLVDKNNFKRRYPANLIGGLFSCTACASVDVQSCGRRFDPGQPDLRHPT